MAADGNPQVNLLTSRHPNGGEGGERVKVQGVGEREMGFVEKEIFLQMELYADEEDDSPEIKRQKRMARTALTMWKEKLETVQLRILQGKSEMRSIMNEVYNLVSLYSVFVGVVLTAVATSNTLVCKHLWSPVGLSVFAYSMLVVVAFTKFREIRALGWMRESYLHVSKETMVWIHKLKVHGYANFNFDRDCQERTILERKVPLWRNALGLIVPLTIFTVGLVFSLVHILCWS